MAASARQRSASVRRPAGRSGRFWNGNGGTRDAARADEAVHVEAARLRVFRAGAVAVDLRRASPTALLRASSAAPASTRSASLRRSTAREYGLLGVVPSPPAASTSRRSLLDVAVPAVGEVGGFRFASPVRGSRTRASRAARRTLRRRAPGSNSAFEQFRPPRVHDRDRVVVFVGAGARDARVGEVAAVAAGGVPCVELRDRLLQLRVARAAERLA